MSGDRFKVCILTAGIGSRLGDLGPMTNKTLLPIREMAVISHIIQKFPDAYEFVFPVGYQAQDVKAYLKLAHPEIRANFVEVSPFVGEGSGPGFSLWSCREQLQTPFYLVCGDTLWEQMPKSREQSWVGVASVLPEESSQFCMIKANGNLAIDLKDKELLEDVDGYRAFVGLFFIKEPAVYFEGLRLKETIKGEYQLSEGLMGLIKNGALLAEPIEGWLDVGTKEKYLAACGALSLMRKREELFFNVNGRVIKFFKDVNVAQNRVKRAQANADVFPKLVGSEVGFFAYEYIPGQVLYECDNESNFELLLNWLSDNLWHHRKIEPTAFKKLTQEFYLSKTLGRVRKFLSEHPSFGGEMIINNQPVVPLLELLSESPGGISWEEIFDGLPMRIHGDLQFSNILFNQDSEKFHLIDWRQDFAGNLEVGDLYYDLAKLYAGLLLDFNKVASGQFRFQGVGDRIDFEIVKVKNFETYEELFKKFLDKKGWSFAKVKAIAGLVYLNMAPLHIAPVDQLLMSLGRKTLANSIQ